MRPSCTLRRGIIALSFLAAGCFWMVDVISLRSLYRNGFPTVKRNDLLKRFHSKPNETEASRNIYRREQVDLRIVVLVYKRASSLKRLMGSLNYALYDGDKVIVEVWIDRSKIGVIDDETFQTATNFTFRHGRYFVNCHSAHVGIFGQWLYAWKSEPNSSEIVLILEDDLTVSPYFYRWLKLVHKKYDGAENINGYTLQGVSIKHSGESGMIDVSKDNTVYLYPVIGTWGFSPNKRNWYKFIEWFSNTFPNDNFHPLVPGNVVTDWYRTFLKSGQSETMWSIWHIYYAWMCQEYTVYPNFAGKNSYKKN